MAPPARRQRLEDHGHPSTPTGAPFPDYGGHSGMNMEEEVSFSQGDNPAPSGEAAHARGLKQKKSIHDRVHGQIVLEGLVSRAPRTQTQGGATAQTRREPTALVHSSSR